MTLSNTKYFYQSPQTTKPESLVKPTDSTSINSQNSASSSPTNTAKSAQSIISSEVRLSSSDYNQFIKEITSLFHDTKVTANSKMLCKLEETLQKETQKIKLAELEAQFLASKGLSITTNGFNMQPKPETSQLSSISNQEEEDAFVIVKEMPTRRIQRLSLLSQAIQETKKDKSSKIEVLAEQRRKMRQTSNIAKPSLTTSTATTTNSKGKQEKRAFANQVEALPTKAQELESSFSEYIW